MSFDDGTHKIYVNSAYNGDDAIGYLMHDFRESNAEKMHYTEIAERNTEIAKTLLKKNKLTLEEIAEASELELEQVKNLAAKG